MSRDIGNNGLFLLKKWERLMLTAYRDEGGVLTIGYGHTGPEIKPGDVITEGEANDLLRQDCAKAIAGVNASLTVDVTQNQFDALVCFTFNVGVGAEAGSTLIKLVNAGNIVAAANQFARWDRVQGRVSTGLDRRRAAERALFETPDA